MFRVSEDDMHMEVRYTYAWNGTIEEIEKIANTAKKILNSPEISDLAEMWTIETKTTWSPACLFIEMQTEADFYSRCDDPEIRKLEPKDIRKEFTKDFASGEYEYFEKIIRRIEDESGVKFED